MLEPAQESIPLVRRAGWSTTQRMLALFIAVDAVLIIVVLAAFAF